MGRATWRSLGVGAKIVESMGSFVPGSGILGGAMVFGASLLNAEHSIEDLQRDLQEVNKQLSDDSLMLSRAFVQALQKEKRYFEERLQRRTA